MKYDALTLDTNIFIAADGIHLEGGVLGQLRQFQQGNVSFILSDIVVREITRRLVAQAEKARELLANAVKNAAKHHLLADNKIDDLKVLHASTLAPNDAVGARLSAFLEATGCYVEPSSNADMQEVLKRYFASEPPFEEGDRKKYEFPDAIALLSLEAAAKRDEEKILAVSATRAGSALQQAPHGLMWCRICPSPFRCCKRMH
jgi:hypothetical protein